MTPAAPRFDAEDLETRARALLASDRVTAPTRAALTARLDWTPGAPRALDPAQMRTLCAIILRVLPLPGLEARLNLAARYDAQLADGPGDGWRYADLPPDVEAQRGGLDALDAVAHAEAGHGFADLAPDRQDALLKAVQAGDPPGSPWPFSPARWFEELLAPLVELAYADPRVQLSIGYQGMADADGWQGAPFTPAAKG